MIRIKNRLRSRKKRRVPQLNTTATADISFMLLIFFLITTSMDSDKGLRRQLPPKDVMKEVKAMDVDRDKVLTIGITQENRYTINDSVVSEKDLRRQTCDFIRRIGDEHIIEIHADRQADYKSYFHLQNILVHVYRNELHNKYHQRITEVFSDKQQPGEATASADTKTGKEATDAAKQ